MYCSRTVDVGVAGRLRGRRCRFDDDRDVPSRYRTLDYQISRYVRPLLLWMGLVGVNTPRGIPTPCGVLPACRRQRCFKLLPGAF